VAKPVAKVATKAAAKVVSKPTSAAASKPTARVPVAKPSDRAVKAKETKPAAPVKPASQSASKATPAAPKQDTKKVVAPPVSLAPKTEKSKGKVMVAVKKTPEAQVAPKGTQKKAVAYQMDEVTGRPLLPAGYRPSADEEYMSPLQLEFFRQMLLSRRAELVEESKQTIENLKDEVRDVGDEAERASRETENALELRTRDRYRKLIGKIDSTLKRVDSGEYGYCVDTGEEIGLDRLIARPQAERTIDAQERWEHSQKLMGD
jgi:DnaK suppressor protein